jgi:hypothetical protein
MKSFLILILLLALAAAAFFTRPSKDDFEQYVVTQSTAGDTNFFSAGWDKMQAENFVNSVQFNDRYLWVDVEQNGNSIYTGAFAHWFNRAAVKADIDTVKKQAGDASDTVSKEIDKGIDNIKQH